LSEQTFTWTGSHNFVKLDPLGRQMPAHIFRVAQA